VALGLTVVLCVSQAAKQQAGGDDGYVVNPTQLTGAVDPTQLTRGGSGIVVNPPSLVGRPCSHVRNSSDMALMCTDIPV
jgi:hypothetical protein